MPPRVTYWLGTWDPSCEAHSREVESLRAAREGRHPVVSLSTGQSSFWHPRKSVIGFSARAWPALRCLAPLIERLGDVSHLFGGLGDWHILRAVGRRPVLFTVTLDGEPCDRSLFDKVTLFAAEDERLRDRLLALGVAPGRIVLIRPGIDVTAMRPGPPPPIDRTFRLLFASSPATADEFDARGVPQLVELARRDRTLRVRCLWRPWGDVTGMKDALAALSPPSNFEVVHGRVTDMRDEFLASHAVVFPFRPGFGKSTPNSVLEGFACGRPALLGPATGIHSVSGESGAAVAASDQSVDALTTALARLRDGFPARCIAARRLAEERFSLDSFLSAYEAAYERVSGTQAK